MDDIGSLHAARASTGVSAHKERYRDRKAQAIATTMTPKGADKQRTPDTKVESRHSAREPAGSEKEVRQAPWPWLRFLSVRAHEREAISH